MHRDEIRDAVTEYLRLINDEALIGAELEKRLRLALDRLALASHFADYVFDDREHPEPPEHEYKALYAYLSRRFPDFGQYNVAAKVTTNVGTAPCNVGDALNDLADITLDLQALVWRWEHTSPDDALCWFEFSFNSHWGQHLRELQSNLHARINGY